MVMHFAPGQRGRQGTPLSLRWPAWLRKHGTPARAGFAPATADSKRSRFHLL
jgi:hypothetical protein